MSVAAKPAELLAVEGRVDKVKSIVAQAEAASASEYVGESTLGTLYFAAGEREKGMDCFLRAAEDRDAGVYMYHPLFVNLTSRVPGLGEYLKSDGRYQSLLRRLGFA